MLSFTDGTHRSSVRTYCALPAGAARQCPSVEPARAQCHPVCRRAGLQVAGLTATVRQLAHRLHPDESLGQEWVLDRVFAHLQREQLLRIRLEAVSLDSTIVKVHPDGTGALKKKRPPSHRQVSRRLDHQAASGCRE